MPYDTQTTKENFTFMRILFLLVKYHVDTDIPVQMMKMKSLWTQCADNEHKEIKLNTSYYTTNYRQDHTYIKWVNRLKSLFKTLRIWISFMINYALKQNKYEKQLHVMMYQ